MSARLCLLAALVLAGCRREAGSASSAPVRVAAASDLAPVFEPLGARFTQQTGLQLAFTFGSSGQLSQQLLQGAPFDAFASADARFVAPLLQAGVCDPASAVEFARGVLVAWTRPGLLAPARLEELAEPRFARVALANPEHAPYGRAAREALTAVGVWERLAGRVVFAENVRTAFGFAQTGNADVALVARTLLGAGGGERALAVDAALHAPLTQTLAVCLEGQATAGGRAFAALVQGAEGRAALLAAGLLPPGSGARAAP